MNPIWYTDITPGHDWLMTSINELIDDSVEEILRYRPEDRDAFVAKRPIFKLAPFFEQMGSGQARGGRGYKKEFWWEREWRKAGDFPVPTRVIVIAPEGEHEEIERTWQGRSDLARHCRYQTQLGAWNL